MGTAPEPPSTFPAPAPYKNKQEISSCKEWTPCGKNRPEVKVTCYLCHEDYTRITSPVTLGLDKRHVHLSVPVWSSLHDLEVHGYRFQ